MATEIITLKLVAQDLASGNISKAVAGIDRMAQRGGIAGSIFQGMGIQFGMMLNPVVLLTRAWGAFTEGVSESVEAARKEEASVIRLSQALESNIEGWKGGATAVEGWLAANQEAFAFADTEQRQSLAGLLGATKDLAEAQNLLNIAMDLARFRSIDLKTASDLLARVYAGNFGTLSRYGIIVQRGATRTEALAEIQRIAGGQASAFAESNEGAAQRTEMAWGDTQEAIGRIFDDIGRSFDDLSRDIASSVQDWLPGTGSDQFLGAIDEMIGRTEEGSQNLFDVITGGFGDIVEAASPTLQHLNQLWDEVEENARAAGVTWSSVGDAQTRLIDAFEAGGYSAEEALAAANGIIRELLHNMASTEVQAEETTAAVVDMFQRPDTKRLSDAIKNIADVRLPDLKQAANEARKAIHRAFEQDGPKSLKALRTEEERLEKQRRRAVRQGNLDALARIDARLAEVDSAITGYRAIQKEIKAEKLAVNTLAAEYGVSKRKVSKLLAQERGDIDKVIERLKALDLQRAEPKIHIAVDQALAAIETIKSQLRSFFGAGIYVHPTINQQSSSRVSGPHRAAGGPVEAGRTYVVGERGPEVLRMGSQRGYISPSGAGLTINIGFVKDARAFAEQVGPELTRWQRGQGVA